MEKDYYTFIEIINSLRKYYQQTQKILNEMTSFIEINPDEPHNIAIRLDSLYKPSERLTIIVEVSKKEKKTIINQIKRFNYNPCAKFCITGDANHFEFQPIKRLYAYKENHVYHPQIMVSKQNERAFGKKLDELKQTNLYLLPETFSEFNPFQTIFVGSHGIGLESNIEFKNYIIIYYYGKDDKIDIESSTKYSPYIIKQLLLTKIPRYTLPKEYLALLDEAKEEVEDTQIIDKIGKKNEKLIIEDRNKSKKMVLRREFPKRNNN